jgi:pimeloyl-ACP methyl ester carboxylesterase
MPPDDISISRSMTARPGGVVLLHGIARSARSFRRTQRALQDAGFATLNLGYQSRHLSLEKLASAIDPAITRFTEQFEGPLHFVAHSMGGLLTRVYLERNRPPRLGRVVMLGTPNQGSEIADRLKDFWIYRGYFGPAGQQLVTKRDHALRALLPAVDYPVGIIAGNRCIRSHRPSCCRAPTTAGCRCKTRGSTA